MLKQIEWEDQQKATLLHEKLIKQTQEKGADIFGFGEYVRAKEPKFWNEHVKTKEGWQVMYKDVPIEVNLKVKIRRIGMKAK
ncbi:MAG: spore gernimation protein GerC [Paenibacillus sp.]|nr:spore gernimation protein GerC [Paenibacillus sp.]